jgi:hypothetical protein
MTIHDQKVSGGSSSSPTYSELEDSEISSIASPKPFSYPLQYDPPLNPKRHRTKFDQPAEEQGSGSQNMGLNFPMRRRAPPKSISQEEALSRVTNYLDAAETDASKHPDAILTQASPVPSQGMESVIMHNMRKLQKGLQGEHITDSDNVPEDDDDFKGAVINTEELYGGEHAQEDANVFDWQDKAAYEQEQDDEYGDVADRIGQQVVEHGINPSSDQLATEVAQTKVKTQAEKDERKKAKKEKKKQEKREKELKRANKD